MSAGGMNDKTGFPVFFTEVSNNLGRYEDYNLASEKFVDLFPPSEFPSVLDICCGIGKMSLALFSQGYKVTAVDLSSEQLEIARKNAPGPIYHQADMKNIPGDNFDLLINVYTSFGYSSTEEEDLALFKYWYGLLRPGGVLLMELADMERARNRINEQGSLVREENGITEYLYMDWDKRLLKVDYHRESKHWSCLTRLYEKETLKDELLKSGFSTVSLYGDFSLKKKEKDDNLVIIARKG